MSELGGSTLLLPLKQLFTPVGRTMDSWVREGGERKEGKGREGREGWNGSGREGGEGDGEGEGEK